MDGRPCDCHHSGRNGPPWHPAARPPQAHRPGPVADDFLIELKVTEKQCFGSAGCLVTTKASVTYIGVYETDELPSLIDITYKIKGATEPYTATIEMEGGQYSPDVANVETKRKSDKLEAVVTSVETY